MKRLAPEYAHRRALPALLALTVLAHANGFGGIPQYDDWNVIVDNPAVASLQAWWDSLPGIRPLLKLSYALNRTAGGLAGFHAVNLGLHLLNVALVLRLLQRLLPARPAGALAGALVFALHPVNTEAVTMLSGRSVSLMSAFFLLSLAAGLAGRTRSSLLAFVAALAVRETALALPAVLALCHYRLQCVEGAARGATALGAALAATRWHWLCALAGAGALLALPRYRELLAYSLQLRDPLANLVTQAHGWLYLLGQWCRPWALNADPVLPLFTQWDARWALLCLAWSVVALATLAGLRGTHWWAFALAWFVLVMAPGHSLVPRLDVVNERHLYLAGVPLGALAGIAWTRLRARRPRAALAAGVLVTALLLALTWQRNAVYATETAFWRDVTRKSPDRARAWNNLGHALAREGGSAAAALEAYERAIALEPADFTARFNREALCGRAPRACARAPAPRAPP